MNKNLLSENMLRFGTKNLSPSAQRELILKSIMETVNQHGLHQAVRRKLMEFHQQLTEAADPAIATTVTKYFASLMNSNKREGAIATAEAVYYTSGNDDPNFSFTSCFVNPCKALYVNFTGVEGIGVMPMIMFMPGSDFGQYRNTGNPPIQWPDTVTYSSEGYTNLSGGAGGFKGAAAIADVVDSMMRYDNIPKDVFLKHLQLRTKLATRKAEIKAHASWPKVKAALQKTGGSRCLAISEFIG